MVCALSELNGRVADSSKPAPPDVLSLSDRIQQLEKENDALRQRIASQKSTTTRVLPEDPLDAVLLVGVVALVVFVGKVAISS